MSVIRKQQRRLNLNLQVNRRNYLKIEMKKVVQKVIIHSSFMPMKYKLPAQLELNKLAGVSARMTNYCQFTARSRSTYSSFKISRIVLKDAGLCGKIKGLIKESW